MLRVLINNNNDVFKRNTSSNYTISIRCDEQAVQIFIPDSQRKQIVELVHQQKVAQQKVISPQMTADPPKTHKQLFLVGSSKDVQLTLDPNPNPCDSECKMAFHLFLESRYCLATLLAKAHTFEYQQHVPTIVGSGLQRLAINILGELHKFPTKTHFHLPIIDVQNLDTCVGKLRSWHIDCDVKFPPRHKRRTCAKAQQQKIPNAPPSSRRNQTGYSILPVIINESGHRITTPDLMLYMRFFKENRHFIAQAMSCLSPWMRCVAHGRGICLNAAILCCSDMHGTFDGMSMQRVSVSKRHAQQLRARMDAEQVKVMTVDMLDGTTRYISCLHVEKMAPYEATNKALNMVLRCGETFVFLGDGVMSDGSRLHTPMNLACSTSWSQSQSQQASSHLRDNLSVNSEFGNIIYRLRYTQAAVCRHKQLHSQQNKLLLQIEQYITRQKNLKPEQISLLRMLCSSFGPGLHGLVALRL